MALTPAGRYRHENATAVEGLSVSFRRRIPVFERFGRSVELARAIWNVLRSATLLAIPVLVVEGIGPIEAVKRSGGLLKRTWGEHVVGNLGIGLVFGLMALAVILVGGALVTVMASVAAPMAIVAIVRPMFPKATLQQAFLAKA